MTYNEAKDHCENMNGTLIKEQRIEDVYNVEIFLPLLNIIFFSYSSIQGSSLESGIIDSDYWIDGEDGVCKTVSNTGEVQEQDCESTNVDSSVMGKPLCQLGIVKIGFQNQN